MKRRILLTLLALLIVALLVFRFMQPKNGYYVDDYGRAHFPTGLDAPKFTEELLSQDADYKVYKVIFDSNGTSIYAKLWVPNNNKKHAAILNFPGAGGTKEGGEGYASLLKGQNVAVFTLDQRGNGETKAQLPSSLQEEFDAFLQNRPPFSLMMVFDGLRAYEYLVQRNDIDAKQIIAIGESMGGRNAIIATAIEPRIKAVIGVSTGGYGMPNGQNANTTKFVRSFDPDNYISAISPRKVVMLHSINDPTEPFSIGQTTFKFANEPKVFYQVSCKVHGPCDEMLPLIKKEVLDILK